MMRQRRLIRRLPRETGNTDSKPGDMGEILALRLQIR